MADIDLSKLDELAPEARDRVSESLKRTLDTELARASRGVAGTDAMAFSRSKGFFFSRSKTSDALRDRVSGGDRLLAEKFETLDDASFAKFADRVTALRKIAREG